MRHIKYILWLSLSLILSACIQKEPVNIDNTIDETSSLVNLNFTNAPFNTKSTGDLVSDLDEESQINLVDIFIFKHSDGSFVNSLRKPFGEDDALSARIKVPKIELDFYVIANAVNNYHTINLSRTSLLTKISSFTDNSTTNFIMVGKALDITPEDDLSIPVLMERISDKVVIKNISKAFTNASLQNSEIVLKDIRLVNVNKKATFFDSIDPVPVQENNSFLNPKGFSSVISSLYGKSVNSTVTAEGVALNEALYFYPNCSTESLDIDTEDYVTKIVFSVEINGTLYRYPIGLPQQSGINNRNKIYTIERLTLNMKGNDESISPNHYLAEGSVTASITVSDWNGQDGESFINGNSSSVPQYYSIFSVDGIDFSEESGTLSASVKSGEITLFGEKDLPWIVKYSSDNRATWSDSIPDFITLSKQSSDGNINGENISVEYDLSQLSGAGFLRFEQSRTGQYYDYYLGNPLCFEALEAGSTIQMTINTSVPRPNLYYSMDKYHWNKWDYSTITLSSEEDKVYFYGSGTYISNPQSGNNYHKFATTGKFSLNGNIESLINNSNDYTYYCFKGLFENNTAIISAPRMNPNTASSNCCMYMFKGCTNLSDISRINLQATSIGTMCYTQMFSDCSSLSDISNITLPATILADNCYNSMFANCISITDVSHLNLPATSLATNCYCSMFENCSNLRTAPVMSITQTATNCCGGMFKGCINLTDIVNISLPSTTVTSSCYSNMFYNCSSLTDISSISLPATTLANYCYNQMFYGCSKITTAPAMAPTTVAQYCCQSMYYGCSSLTDISSISLPATTLANYCYNQMFYGCSKITTAPAMAPTTVAPYCCRAMFYECISLVDISHLSLPATTLADYCYGDGDGFMGDNTYNKGMFSGCTSLRITPQMAPTIVGKYSCASMFYNCSSLVDISGISLPATSLSEGCYNKMFGRCTLLCQSPDINNPDIIYASALCGMFKDCYSLTTFVCNNGFSPSTINKMSLEGMFSNCVSLTDISGISLPATTLAERCYKEMFKNCGNITSAPELPAENLVFGCYLNMFYDCSSLTYVKAMFITTPSSTYTDDWLYGVPSSGTFVKNASATWTLTGASGIPSGWTVETAAL